MRLTRGPVFLAGAGAAGSILAVAGLALTSHSLDATKTMLRLRVPEMRQVRFERAGHYVVLQEFPRQARMPAPVPLEALDIQIRPSQSADSLPLRPRPAESHRTLGGRRGVLLAEFDVAQADVFSVAVALRQPEAQTPCILVISHGLPGKHLFYVAAGTVLTLLGLMLGLAALFLFFGRRRRALKCAHESR